MNTQNQIPSDWQKVELDDIVEVHGGGTPSTKNRNCWNGNIPWLTPAELTNYNSRTIAGTASYITESGLKNSSAKLMPEKSILFTSRATIGNITINTTPMATNQGFINIEPKKVDRDFFYYWLKDKRRYLNQIAIGSTFPELSKSVFKQIETTIPKSKNEQRKIGKLLSKFDDKIEINNKIADILSKMVQTIFKEWFVNLRFPGYEKVKMVELELGKIPEGWKEGKLDELVNIRNGYAFKSGNYKDNGIPIVRTLNFTSGGSVVLDDVVYLSQKEAKLHDNFYLDMFDFLLVMVGASIGKVAIVPSSILPALQNQNMWNFKPKMEEYRLFNIFLLRRLINQQRRSATGSARDFFRKDYFYSLDVVIPKPEIVRKFDKVIRPIYLKLDRIIGENQKLTKMRDLILPKLMRGEIRIN